MWAIVLFNEVYATNNLFVLFERISSTLGSPRAVITLTFLVDFTCRFRILTAGVQRVLDEVGWDRGFADPLAV